LITELDVPNQLDRTDASKQSDSITEAVGEHTQKEVQDYQKGGFLKDIFQPKCVNESTTPFLPSIILTSESSEGDKPQQPKSLSQIVRENEKVFDADGDGEITQKELGSAAANSALDKNVLAAVVALTKNYDALADLNYESIVFSKSLTVKDIDAFCNMAKDSDRTVSQTELMNSVDGAMKITINQADNVNHDLFGKDNEISPKAVQQGGIGDCSFLAVLASMASTAAGREAIRGMIKSDGDAYIVSFPNGDTTRVQKPTAAELTLYAGNNGNGMWPAILEKAYGQILAEKYKKDVNAPQLAADGCEKYGPMNTLTGEKPCIQTVEPCKMTDDELHDALVLMSRKPMVITAGTGPNVDAMVKAGNQPMAERVDANGNPIEGKEPVAISGFHVYSIERYDPESRSVFLRNPHDGTQLLKMPLSTYRQAFVGMSSVQDERLVDQPTKYEALKSPNFQRPNVA